jgi:hypothetical protein
MQVGDIFHGYDSYGGSGHCLGLFRVVKLGNKFASLRKIESERVTATIENGDACSGTYSCSEWKAKLPFEDVHVGRPIMIAYDNYDEKSSTSYCSTASMCCKIYTRILPNKNGDHCYTSEYTQHYR